MGQIGSVYKQPETEVDDSCHSWRVPSKWKGCKGKLARGAKGIGKGSKGKRAVYICNCNVCMCKKNIECSSNAAVVYIIIITRMNVVDNLNSV